MPARYVRAYVKTNKHDAADAEACWEAVQLRIPIYSGRVFRREAGHRSDLKPATIPK